MTGSIHVVGIGPGDPSWLAPAAREAIEAADVILGYRTYLDQVRDIAPGTPREGSGMRREVERARRAIELARGGGRVALVSGGDPGVYGMAGLVYELLGGDPGPEPPATPDPGPAPSAVPELPEVSVTVVPGITALTAAASLLGAPLMTDFAAISLSDQLTPLEDILRRVTLAAQAGFVLCLYNPRSHRRVDPFDRTCAILLLELSPGTPVGVVKAAYRPGQEIVRCRLADLPTLDVGMDTIVIVGNASTRWIGDALVTPRGYEHKYDLGGTS